MLAAETSGAAKSDRCQDFRHGFLWKSRRHPHRLQNSIELIRLFQRTWPLPLWRCMTRSGERVSVDTASWNLVDGTVPFWLRFCTKQRGLGSFRMSFSHGRNTAPPYAQVEGGENQATYFRPRNNCPNRVVLYILRSETVSPSEGPLLCFIGLARGGLVRSAQLYDISQKGCGHTLPECMSCRILSANRTAPRPDQ